MNETWRARLARTLCLDAETCTACLADADALLPVVRDYADQRTAEALRAAAAEQRAEAGNVPDTDEGTHADGHRCAAGFLDRRAGFLDALAADPGHTSRRDREEGR